MDRFDAVEILREYFDDKYILDSLIKAMSESEALDLMGYIARMEDLDEWELRDMENKRYEDKEV